MSSATSATRAARAKARANARDTARPSAATPASAVAPASTASPPSSAVRPSSAAWLTQSLRGRKRLVDGAWLLTGLVLASVAGALDGLRLVQIDLPSFLTSMAGFALIYVSGSLWTGSRMDEQSRERALLWLQVIAVGMLGILWLQLGGVAVPAFAVLFLLPIATSGIAFSRWHPVFASLAVIGAVGGVAALTSPAFRDYAGSRGAAFPNWLAWLAGRSAELGGGGFGMTPSGQDTAIMLVVLLGVAVAVGAVSSRFSDVAAALDTAVARSSGEVVAAHDFADAIFEHAPDDLALVDPASGDVARATRSFRRRFGSEGSERGRSFLDVVGFHLPDQVEPALHGGNVRPTPHSGGGAFGVSSLKVRPVSIDGRSLSLVSMADESLLHQLLTALDTDPDFLVLLDNDARVLWLNEAARGVFGAAGAASRAAQVLELQGLPSGWWEPGPRETVRRPLHIDNKAYQAELRSSKIPGTSLRVVWIRVSPS